ncbi:unnamed protein product [Ambrosiozyma monospora]|uniref:Unnamed protein product n=1 Tax=Ambrosiozyma monospora TaxID=43982 RepID=A0ACB5TDX9_AMBMO|nr:unnamed protein product [Ambrosiozyma monospora]
MLDDLILSYLSHQELFSLAIGLLITLDKPNSREIIAEVLPRYETKSNDDLEWALSICAKLRLHQTAEKIYKLQGDSLQSNGFLYESLYCFAQAGDNVRLVDAVWKLFETLLVEGEYKHDPLLISKIENNEIDQPMLRQALAPFVLLYQFLNQDQAASAAGKHDFRKLFKLLGFTYIPPHYKIVLLLILTPYFNKGEFTLADLMMIIKSLNVYEKQIKESEESFRLSEELYQLALSKLAHKQCSDASFDWREESELPGDVSSFILKTRKDIGYNVSFKFIEETDLI